MPITPPPPFSPKYRIANKLAASLLRLEGAKERINTLPITPTVLASLRQTAKLFSTHYSTSIEGNRLSQKDVKKVIAKYFVDGMADAFSKVEEKAKEAENRWETDKSPALRNLDPRQRKALTLFTRQKVITSNDLAALFTFAPRTARLLAQKWTRQGFFVIADPSKKARKYKLSPEFEKLF